MNNLFYEPPEHFDLILQRVLLPLQRLLVDDLDGHQLAGGIAALRQSHFRESTAANAKRTHPGSHRGIG